MTATSVTSLGRGTPGGRAEPDDASTLWGPPPLPERANCSDLEVLPLIGEAFRSPRGPAATRMSDQLCSGCDIRNACLAEAKSRAEHGIWGGTTPGTRRRHGAPRVTGGPWW